VPAGRLPQGGRLVDGAGAGWRSRSHLLRGTPRALSGMAKHSSVVGCGGLISRRLENWRRKTRRRAKKSLTSPTGPPSTTRPKAATRFQDAGPADGVLGRRMVSRSNQHRARQRSSSPSSDICGPTITSLAASPLSAGKPV